MSWVDRLQSRGSALCVGIDPDPERMPPGVGLFDFCAEVVDLTAARAACFKPNIAFFERLGPEGVAEFARLLEFLGDRGLPVVVDAKRGDIASTARAYAEAYLGGPFDCDALTVNASVGLDAIEPFRERARLLDKGLFLLLRTSNPGAALFQAPAEPVLAEAIEKEPAYGAVVGATDPETGRRLRAAMPRTLFLVPGYGAQGGARLDAFFDAEGRGALVNSSRGILYAGEGRRDWKAAVRAAADHAYETVEKARKAKR